MKILKRAYNSIGAVIGLFFGILLAVSAYAHLISPEKFHYAAYLAIVFPGLLLLNLFLLVFWAVQWNRVGLITLFFLLVCSGQIFRYSPLHVIPRQYEGGDTLSLLTYNVCAFSQYARHTPRESNDIIEYIKSSGADVVCIQEYGYSTTGRDLRKSDIDTALTRIYPYRRVFAYGGDWTTRLGIACYSRHPIKDAGHILSPGQNSSVLYTLDINGRELSLVVNHLASNKLSLKDRGFFRYLSNHIDKIDEYQEGIKEHLVRKFGLASMLRASQADTISEAVGRLGDNLIVCGDFNDTPQSYTYSRIRGNLGDAYVSTGNGPGITYNRDHFYFRIDHVLYGKALRPLKTEIDRVCYSDHYPVKVLFEWTDGGVGRQ